MSTRRSFLKKIFGAAVIAPALPAIIAEATKPALPLAVGEEGVVLMSTGSSVSWMKMAEVKYWEEWYKKTEEAYWYGTPKIS